MIKIARLVLGSILSFTVGGTFGFMFGIAFQLVFIEDYPTLGAALPYLWATAGACTGIYLILEDWTLNDDMSTEAVSGVITDNATVRIKATSAYRARVLSRRPPKLISKPNRVLGKLRNGNRPRRHSKP